MRDFKQHDITDCGPACLAYVFSRYDFNLSISAIRQKAGTNQSGTTALGLVETAKECGFEAKGIRCKFDDLRVLPKTGIAHVITGKGTQHYIVVCSIGKKSMKVMDPALGRIEKWSLEKFKAIWTHVYIVLSPATDFAPSAKKESPLLRILVLLKPHKKIMFQALMGVVLGTILSLSNAIFIQKIVDNVIVDGNRNLLRLLGIAMLSILVIRTLISYFQSILLLRAAQKIDAGLILGYYRHVMRLPQSFFDTMRVGEIISRVGDAGSLRDFLTGTLLNLVINPLILIFALSAMFIYSWRLAVFSLVLVPANTLIYLASDWLNKRYQREIMERSADYSSQMVESLNAISVVRSCCMEEEMSFRNETRMVRLLKRIWTAARAGYVIGSGSSIITQAYSIGLLWMGAGLVLDSYLTAGELMSCNALAGYITGPIVSLIGMNSSIRAATTATERLYEILDLEVEEDEGSADIIFGDEFELSIEDLSFCYPGRASTLKDISIRFRSGCITALAGKSGCGKSTLLGLIQRHYNPGNGRIMLNGVNIAYAKLRSLRASVAHVPQRIDLLQGSILENLAPNDPHPDMPQILDLCKNVGILEFIESLPRGFQTHVAENGANLSGGQKQRLAIVRALYSDAPIVLMDEPSSALDADSEDMLVTTLMEMRDAGKLIILAVHNQRLLSICDQRIEMDKGMIVSTKTMPPPNLIKSNDRIPSPLSLPCDSTQKTNARVIYQRTDEAQILFENMRDQTLGGVMLGHDHANVMGINEDGSGWFLEEGRCDVFSVTGQMPALYGFDLGSFKNGWSPTYDYVIPKIMEASGRGGVILVSWYPDNPLTDGNCQNGCCVEDLLPGGQAHNVLCEQLDLIAMHLGNLKNAQGHSIPILFRAWQQQNGDHFWWGRSRCTQSEYIRLFRFTVSYFRETHNIRNFLYCFCPGDYSDKFSDLMERYPGDSFVDVIGLEGFLDESVKRQQRLLHLTKELVQWAESKGKVPALTHLGFDNGEGGIGLAHCQNPKWLDDNLLGPLLKDPIACRITFAKFATNEAHNPKVFHLPHSGSSHADCLATLCRDGDLVFVDGIQEIYQKTHTQKRFTLVEKK